MVLRVRTLLSSTRGSWMQSHAGREEGGVWRVLPVLGDGFWLSYLPEPSRAGAAGWGWGQRKLEDISCLTDRTGLINVPKPR